jgi:F-type H+-transporting ATPase subunit gamma
MATLRDIRRRITGVTNTSKITQAMRMVSAAKLRRAQSAIESARPYVLKLGEILRNVSENVGEDYSNPLLDKHHDVKNIAIIVIASDRGLCGSFNTNLFRKAEIYIKTEMQTEFPGAQCHIIPVGKRSVQYFHKSHYNVVRQFPDVFARLDFSTAKDIVNLVSQGFIDGIYDRVLVFFNEFKNILTQVPDSINLLPIEPTALKDNTGDSKSFNIDYIFEPDKKKILDEILPKNLDIQLWRTLLESNAAEQAARMMAMENATDNAKDLIKHLELVFNKERQAAITKEMLEIVGGANALKKT